MSPFRVVLETPGEQPSLSALKGAVVVIQHGVSSASSARAHVVTRQGVREEPWLLSGLQEQARASGQATSDADHHIAGSLGFGGSFPLDVTRGYSTGAQVPGACCFVAQGYRDGHWKTLTEPQEEDEEEYADWDSCDVRPFPFRAKWQNGVELWERLECTDQGKRSTLYRDPKGKKRALRQRQHKKECGGEPRLKGAMSGVTLADGGLLLAGNDCQTHRAITEYFPQGSLSSRLVELPGEPGEIYSGHVASSDPIGWENVEAGTVTIVFPSTSGKHPPRPYMARFNGKKWTDLSPPEPAAGIPISYGTLEGGGVWISTRPIDFAEYPGAQLWFDRSGKGDAYEEILAPMKVDLGEVGSWTSPAGQPFILVVTDQNRQGLLHYGSKGWEILPLPTRCASCGKGTTALRNLEFLDEEPIIALGGGECGCVARLGGPP